MTGVQTCALPISLSSPLYLRLCGGGFVDFSSLFVFAVAVCGDLWVFVRSVLEDLGFFLGLFWFGLALEIWVFCGCGEEKETSLREEENH